LRKKPTLHSRLGTAKRKKKKPATAKAAVVPVLYTLRYGPRQKKEKKKKEKNNRGKNTQQHILPTCSRMLSNVHEKKKSFAAFGKLSTKKINFRGGGKKGEKEKSR